MFPFVLYLVTGAVTGVHVYTLLMMGMYGAPPTVLENVSFFGSLCLLIFAYVSLSKPHFAAKLALLASMGMWSFYGPGIAGAVREMRWYRASDLRIVGLPYLAGALLLLTTVYSTIVSFRKVEIGNRGTWVLPERATRPARITVGVATVMLVLAFVAWVAIDARNSTRPSSRFLIPDGYVGWVRIEFQIAGAPPAPVERGQYVFKIPPDGILRTSSPEKFGWGKDEYYYDSATGLSRLPTDASNGLVWGQINGEQGGTSGPRQYEEFFVGTEQQFKELAGTKRAGSKPVADAPR